MKLGDLFFHRKPFWKYMFAILIRLRRQLLYCRNITTCGRKTRNYIVHRPKVIFVFTRARIFIYNLYFISQYLNTLYLKNIVLIYTFWYYSNFTFNFCVYLGYSIKLFSRYFIYISTVYISWLVYYSLFVY